MKILALTAENVKRLKAVHIEPDPDGHLVVVSGANAQGKTSVLDSIWLALGGAAAGRETAQPIRNGEDYASVTLDLGDLLVTRAWTGDKTTLKVESKDGAKYSSPQTMLDGLVGRLSFDPLAFAQQDQKTQRATLLSLVDLPFDPDELDARRRSLFDRRTDVGRQVKSLAGQLDGMPPLDESLPAEEQSLSGLLEEASQVRITIERVRQERDQLDHARAKVEELRERLRSAERDVEVAEKNVAALPDLASLPDPGEIESRLRGLEQTNREIREQAKRRDVEAEHDQAKTFVADLTEQIRDLDERRTKALAEAAMPIAGLGFDEDGVTYQDVPLKQASAAEQLRVSVAMAMSLNPKVRVIRITDGSLLDSHNLALIEEMAAEHDFQVWIERVDETGAVGIVIEDGEVLPS